jgi:hypothetical protein
MALAIRLQNLIRAGGIIDYSQLAQPRAYAHSINILRDHQAGRAFLWPDHSYGLMKLRKKKSETQVMDFGFEF